MPTMSDNEVDVDDKDDIDLISSSLTLPNGIIISNRLAKAAMEEGIAHGGGCPGPSHRRLYQRWGSGGWGVIITGNVQVDKRHLSTPHDRIIPDSSPSTIAGYSLLHSSIVDSNPSPPLTLVQLSHPGLQSSPTIGLSRLPCSPAVAPIASRPDLGDSALGWVLAHVIWPRKSKVLDVEGWLDIVKRFVDGAKVMEEAGWDGVQIHSAHGYLLAEYLSPLTNPYPSPLPGVPDHIPIRLHLLYLILRGITATTSTRYVKSVKINCSDFAQGGLDEKQAAEIVKKLVSWDVIHILEISGGTYTNPAFAAPETIDNPILKTSNSNPTTRQSLFAHFTTSLLPFLPPPPHGPAILLTGGLHDRQLIAASIRNRACDLVGIARPACISPELPRDIILNRDVDNQGTYLGGYSIRGAGLIKWAVEYGSSSTPKQGLPGSNLDGKTSNSQRGIPLVGSSVSTFWHEWQLCRIGRGLDPDISMHWFWGGVMLEMIWWGILGGGPLGWWEWWMSTRRKV